MTALNIAEFNRLKLIEKVIEKSDNVINYFSRCENDIELLNFIQELEKNRNDETEKLHKNMANIFKLLQLCRNLIKSEEDEDLKSFKMNMIELQDNVQDFNIKLKHCLAAVEDEEIDLTEDLLSCQKKMDEWSKPIKVSPIINFKMNPAAPSSEITEEVQQFMDFVHKSKGHENGWSKEDHQLFIKYRKKYRNIDTVAKNLHKTLPDINEEAIKQHGKWYKQYLDLQRKMKQSLDEWRKKKSLKSVEIVEEQSFKPNPKFSVTKEVKDEDVKTKIALWKSEKAAKRQKQLEEDLQKQMQRKQFEKQKQRLNEELKKSVDKWKEARARRKELETLEKEINEFRVKKEKAKEANKMIKQFQSHDDIFITRMREAKKCNDKEVVQRSKSSTVANRDPERLLRPTQQWLQRTLKRDRTRVTIEVPNIRKISKLKIPEWRKNIGRQ